MTGEPDHRGGLSESELNALQLARDQVIHPSGRGGRNGGFALDVRGPDVVTDEVKRAASQLPSRPLAEVLEGRRSTTHLDPFDLTRLVAVLSRAYRIQAAGVAADGSPWTLRPVPSAGATHPFDLLVSVEKVAGIEPGRYIFNPHTAGLLRLGQSWNEYAALVEVGALRASRRDEPAPATVTLVAEAKRATCRYGAALTVILRDAGVLLQTLHILASDVGLASSIVGSAGHVAERDDVAFPIFVVDCGAVVLGVPSNRGDRQ
ncbi:MAG: hypothetical protein NTX33_00050 [Propionibacteriales bacterium]|nr:hypothetical protein [Propionibacteriales bacterium]